MTEVQKKVYYSGATKPDGDPITVPEGILIVSELPLVIGLAFVNPVLATIFGVAAVGYDVVRLRRFLYGSQHK